MSIRAQERQRAPRFSRRGFALSMASVLVAFVGCADASSESPPDGLESSSSGQACESSFEGSAELVEIAVAVRGNAGPMLAWGEQQGCFAEHGLTVTVTEVSDDAAGVAGLVSQSWDVISFTPFAMVQAIANSGVELTTLAPWYGYTEEELARAREEPLFEGTLLLNMAVVTMDTEVSSWADLDGGVVAAGSVGGIAEATVQAAIKQSVGEDAEASIMALPPADAMSALERGDISAAVLTGLRAVQAIEAGARVIGYPGAFFYEEGPANIFVTHEKIVSSRPELLDFQDAIISINSLLNSGAHEGSFRQVITADFGYSEDVADEIIGLRLDTVPLGIEGFTYLVPKMKAQGMIRSDFELSPKMFLAR